ncbi:hypothetical protein FISHEDRAFT_75967 [Fistulina hepatica ATCC 64428]|uniref:Uncharacterized protein n=1 Tax=Fistulina hepatica ATCC 64428 TaxID=1128425 RepID=A0A0D7A6X3_9AGAR|nr:hypothetical protein FISHEDRAFT_75967 [Fistulina hepatica ATCC 64428]
MPFLVPLISPLHHPLLQPPGISAKMFVFPGAFSTVPLTAENLLKHTTAIHPTYDEQEADDTSSSTSTSCWLGLATSTAPSSPLLATPELSPLCPSTVLDINDDVLNGKCTSKADLASADKCGANHLEPSFANEDAQPFAQMAALMGEFYSLYQTILDDTKLVFDPFRDEKPTGFTAGLRSDDDEIFVPSFDHTFADNGPIGSAVFSGDGAFVYARRAATDRMLSDFPEQASHGPAPSLNLSVLERVHLRQAAMVWEAQHPKIDTTAPPTYGGLPNTWFGAFSPAKRAAPAPAPTAPTRPALARAAPRGCRLKRILCENAGHVAQKMQGVAAGGYRRTPRVCAAPSVAWTHSIWA